jgi:phosphoglycolate phosphatase
MKYTTILFDLDGTLTDPFGGLTCGFIYAFKKMSVDYGDRRSLSKYIGPPLLDRWMRDFGWSEAEARLAVAYFREYFGVYGWWDNKLYPGAMEMLRQLKRAGLRIALATSKPEIYAGKILRLFGIDGYFDMVGAATSDHTRDKKEDVIKYVLSLLGISDKQKDEVLLVGDTVFDKQGADSVGIDFLPVLYGYGSPGDFEDCALEAAMKPSDIVRIILGR